MDLTYPISLNITFLLLQTFMYAKLCLQESKQRSSRQKNLIVPSSLTIAKTYNALAVPSSAYLKTL
jgi:hypothetical protein